MRGTKAKALRRLARAATEGAPAKAYLSRRHDKKRAKQAVTPVLDGEDLRGKKTMVKVVNGIRKLFKRETETYQVRSEEVRLDPASTHGYYKRLKTRRV